MVVNADSTWCLRQDHALCSGQYCFLLHILCIGQFRLFNEHVNVCLPAASPNLIDLIRIRLDTLAAWLAGTDVILVLSCLTQLNLAQHTSCVSSSFVQRIKSLASQLICLSAEYSRYITCSTETHGHR